MGTLLLLSAVTPLLVAGVHLGPIRDPATAPCFDAANGDQCNRQVAWAMAEGMRLHPEWYKKVAEPKGFFDFQEFLWQKGASGCQKPCRARPVLAGAPVPVANRSALLVVAGLTRHFEVTWPKLEQSFLLPNEAAGYKFRIIFSTDVDLQCHPNSSKWQNRHCEEPTERESHLRHIREVFAPRTVEVMHLASVCNGGSSKGSMLFDTLNNQTLPCEVGSELGPDNGTELLQRRYCFPWFERVHAVLKDVVERGETFDRVVALRPDMVLHRQVGGASQELEGVPRPGGPPRLLLDKMCAKRPGFSFVTPTFEQPPGASLHNRDIDFMHILCPGHKLPVYEEASGVPGDGCKHHEPFVEQPPGFISSPGGWRPGTFMCRFVQLFNQSGVPIAHWDDSYHTDWPRKFPSQACQGGRACGESLLP